MHSYIKIISIWIVREVPVCLNVSVKHNLVVSSAVELVTMVWRLIIKLIVAFLGIQGVCYFWGWGDSSCSLFDFTLKRDHWQYKKVLKSLEGRKGKILP